MYHERPANAMFPAAYSVFPFGRFYAILAAMDKRFLTFYSDTPKYTHAPGLDVMRQLMTRLGDPQKKLRCIHIAGTNGKGSCACMTSAMLQAAGYRTGLYTSPDLTGPWERMKVNGVDITLESFAEITADVRDACTGLNEPSFFEKMTAAAFLYFAQQGCDCVVLEAGLGGRLDATNIIDAPVVSVIMPIGLDHTAQLGNTLAAIAGEKAGIVKPGCPVVSAPQPAEAMAVIQERCDAVNTPLRVVDINNLHLLSRSLSCQRFDYGEMKNISISLLGDHQLQNAAAAIEAAKVMGLEEISIRAGLAKASWPCRFEYIPGTPPFILDGAHNGHGTAALAAALRTYFPKQKLTFIMGVMADKDWQTMTERMEPLAARFICLAPEGERALPAEVLAGSLSVPARTAGTPEEAAALARQYPDPVCAFGSLYYVGALRQFLKDGMI